MEQLAFIDTKLSRETRRKIEKLLSSYRNMDAIIESMEKDLPQPKMTPSYNASESQRGNQFYSEVENIVLIKDKLNQKRIIKNKLDLIYQSLRPVQKKIWEQRYILGRYDDIVIGEVDVSRRTYYREKDSLLRIVGEAFYLL